ncbi:hypothetical protein HPB48_015511 [Haemaphysalis longicornis]|uniref:Uncharacterized protein n=1 Tax=Haemaphysalis longicornis TaxID=44386 RepID=A0A9J6FID2_HAELO|nr:hypothetical protein HPB48_015511 [Haemaphysalis longicornis]
MSTEANPPRAKRELCRQMRPPPVELALWDTAGQEDYDRLRQPSYQDTDVIWISFTIGSPDSLENIPEEWTPEVGHFCPNVPIILVGNKDDLRKDLRELANMKQKPTAPEEGRTVAKVIAYEHLECSAKTKDGVREVLETSTRFCPPGQEANKAEVHPSLELNNTFFFPFSVRKARGAGRASLAAVSSPLLPPLPPPDLQDPAAGQNTAVHGQVRIGTWNLFLLRHDMSTIAPSELAAVAIGYWPSGSSPMTRKGGTPR